MCQSCIHVGEKTLESIQCISCPVGCAYSADNPSCSCRRLAKWGGQLPWVRLFLSCPKIPFLPRQAAHIVKTTVLLSGWDLYTQTQRHTVTPQHSQPFVFIAPVSPRRATSVGGTQKKKQKTRVRATSCRQICWANSHTELSYYVQRSSFINLTGNLFS